MDELPHRCSDDDPSCTCEVHNKPMYYWPAGDDHACQESDCKYAHGANAVIHSEYIAKLARRRRVMTP